VTAPPGSAAEAADYPSPYSALFFGEVDYREGDGPGDDGFVIGQGVGQLSGELDTRLSVFTEITATARQGEDFEFEVERLFVRYDFSDQFKLSAGRYHTPIGYWNTAYHHGSWLQTSVGRPETMRYGSNVIPIHFMGMLLEGRLWESNFGYKLGWGNGRCQEINDPCDLGDDNGEMAFLGQINYRPLNAHRMETGLTVYVDTATPAEGPETDELLANGYLAFQGESPEIITEFTYARHERTDTPGPDGSTSSVYIQMAYRLWGDASNFKPYIRGEHLDVDNDDPLLGTLGLDYDGVIGGVRWDFSNYAALKFEVRTEEFGDQPRQESAWIQLSFVFDPATRRSERTQTLQQGRSGMVNYR